MRFSNIFYMFFLCLFISRNIFLEDFMEAIKLRAFLLHACQMAYRKHHLDDDSIGWDELSNVLHDALCNVMTDEGFIEWLESLKNDVERSL